VISHLFSDPRLKEGARRTETDPSGIGERRKMKMARWLSIAAVLISAVLAVGCGADNSKSSTSSGAAEESPYVRRLESITDKLNSSSGKVELDDAINAEGPDADQRLAAAIESYLPEMSRYLTAVERLHPPQPCRTLHADLIRTERDSRRMLRQVLPLLHRGTSREVNLYFVRLAPTIEADKKRMEAASAALRDSGHSC
jgi:hypothetical protein